MHNDQHNVYYEIPGAGGGNVEYANRASAVAEAKRIAEHYPDSYVEARRVVDQHLSYRHNGYRW
jgi:hypothetical protein